MSTVIDPVQGTDDNRGVNIVILVSVLTFFSIITTVLRLGVRGANRHLSWDDYLIASAVVLVVVQCPFNVLQVEHGFGYHVKYLIATNASIAEAMKWTWLAELFLFLVLPITKISICFFIFRIKDRGWLKWFLYALIAGLVATNGLCIIILLAQCNPVAANWNRALGKCWNVRVYNDAIWLQVAYGILSDFLLSLLPIVVLWNVKIAIRFKVAISGLMSIGLIATACAAVRAYLSAANNGSADLTWDLAIVVEWALLEEHFAILGANLALSRYIFKFFRNGRRGSTPAQGYSHMSSLHRNRAMTANGNTTHRASVESEIPLSTAIKKTTEFFVVREPSTIPSEGNRSKSFDLERGDSRLSTGMIRRDSTL